MADARRRAVVSGGLGGIGLSVRAWLVKAGNDVAVTARNAERLRAAVQSAGARWRAVEASVTAQGPMTTMSKDGSTR